MKPDEIERWATKAFWNDPAARPRGDSRQVFLARALDEVGRALTGDEWTGGEASDAADSIFGAPILPQDGHKRPYPKIPPPVPPSLAGGSTNFNYAHYQEHQRRYDEQGKRRDAHVHDWREHRRTMPIIAEYTRQAASWARLNKAMDWIAEHGAEGGRLVTKGRSVLGGDYFDLPTSTWNIENLWLSRFRHCQFVHRGLQTYIFLTRESLDHCIRKIPKLKAARKHPSSLADLDAPLIEAMHSLIKKGEESGPNPAALRVVDEAAGFGQVESRARRLERGYIKKYGNSPS